MPRKSPRPQKPKVFYVFREDQKGTLKKWIKKGINPFFAIFPILDPLEITRKPSVLRGYETGLHLKFFEVLKNRRKKHLWV